MYFIHTLYKLLPIYTIVAAITIGPKNRLNQFCDIDGSWTLSTVLEKLQLNGVYKKNYIYIFVYIYLY